MRLALGDAEVLLRVRRDIVDVRPRLASDPQLGHGSRRLAHIVERTLAPNALRKLLGCAFDEIPRLEVGDTRIERVTQNGELLPLKRITHHVNNTGVLPSPDALLGERLKVLGKLDAFRCVGHG